MVCGNKKIHAQVLFVKENRKVGEEEREERTKQIKWKKEK